MRPYDHLRPTAIAIMEAPDAHGVELDDHGLHAVPSPVNRHTLAVSRLLRQLDPQLAPDKIVHAGTPQIDAPALGRIRRPDLVVVPEAALARPGSTYLRPEDVELAAEVVPFAPRATRTDWPTIPPWASRPMSSSTRTSQR